METIRPGDDEDPIKTRRLMHTTPGVPAAILRLGVIALALLVVGLIVLLARG